MRLTTVILIAALMQVSAAGLAQKITISKKQADLRAVLKALRTQSGYNFVYADNVLSQAKPVDISVKAADFKDVLAQIFANQPLTYKIDNNVIIVQIKPTVLTQPGRKNIRVSGVITEEEGNPLQSAGIRAKGGDK